jgi:chromosome segregation ATPase
LIRQQLTAEHVEAAIKTAVSKLRERRRRKPDEAQALKREVAKLEREMENLIAAIEAGGSGLERLTARVAEKQAEIDQRQELLAKLESAEVVTFDRAKFHQQLSRSLDRFHDCW